MWVFFEGGCLTGERHSGVQLHGFLSYLVKVALSEGEYTIFGYKGKQVRDQIHSSDVIAAMEAFASQPRPRRGLQSWRRARQQRVASGVRLDDRRVDGQKDEDALSG